MALEGTLKDFGLADILQLIGIQRKTGLLTLQNDEETVEVQFLEGSVVGVDTSACRLEDRLGNVLVRTGKMTDAQLKDALRMQQRTLQRLGHVIVKSGAISEEDLVDALRVQSLQILYRLFRWRDGNYSVTMLENLDYDERHFVPVSAETILMEGARMVDEWPLIERRIKSDQMIFRQTEAAEGIDLSAAPEDDADLEFDFNLDGGTEDQAGAGDEEESLSLSPEEREILVLVDGQRTVLEINDRSSLGDFDTYRILCELLTRDLIVEVKRTAPAAEVSRTRGLLERALRGSVQLALAASALVGLLVLELNPLTPWKVSGQGELGQELKLSASHGRLERIDEALQVYYLVSGDYPAALEELPRQGYLAPSGLRDPWGRPYRYRRSPGGYQLFGHDESGRPSAELTVSHRFSAAQQMMLGGAVVANP